MCIPLHACYTATECHSNFDVKEDSCNMATYLTKTGHAVAMAAVKSISFAGR